MGYTSHWWPFRYYGSYHYLIQFNKKEKMNKESILGIIRHILTFGGGFMTQNGIATDSEVTTGVSAAVTLVGVIWSILSKKK